MVLLPVYYSLRNMFTFLLLADGRAGSAGEALKMSAAGGGRTLEGYSCFSPGSFNFRCGRDDGCGITILLTLAGHSDGENLRGRLFVIT